MAGTVVVDARVRLVAILSAGVLPGFQVHYSHPGDDHLGDKAVWFEPARASVDPITLRATKQRREEVIVQPMVIHVRGEGMDQQAADAACIEALAAIEDAMALTANVTLVGALADPNQQIIHCLLRGWEQTYWPYDGGNAAGIRAEWEIKARSL